jgi:putative ABC transport system permease protein
VVLVPESLRDPGPAFDVATWRKWFNSVVAHSWEALRHALRRFRRQPGQTAALVLIVAVGIGVSTAVFSVVRRVLLRPIPVAELHRLAVAWETDPSREGSLIEVSFPYFREWRAQNRSFEDMAAYGSVNWGYEFKGPLREAVSAAYVSASFFDTMRARALVGRTFRPEEDEPAAERVIVLSHRLWQRRFGGDPKVIGAKTFGDEPFTIVGVMPNGFDFPQGAELWTPVGPALEADRRRNDWTPAFLRGLGVLYVVGRLKEGVPVEAARADLAEISRRLSVADGFSTTGGWSARLVPLADHYLGASTRQALEALAAASAFVLLLACANVTVLLLVQAIRRRTDLAVRRALGASAGQVVLQQLLDSALLALAGGAAGTLLAIGAVRAAGAFGPSGVPGLADVAVDGRALAFAVAVTAATAVIVALAPAWAASRVAIAPTLRSGGAGGGLDRRGHALTRLLVTSEVALSVVLLVGCGLMVRSLQNLLTVDLGFVPKRALTLSVDFVPEKYPTTAQDRAFHRRLVERLASLPGVEAAGAVHNRPLEYGPIGSDNWVLPEGSPLDRASVTTNSISANWEAVTPDYFRAIGTRLVEGRAFTEDDTPDVPRVVIVSRSLARRAWPGQSPLGKRLHTYPAKSDLNNGVFVDVEWLTVVGVVEDARYRGIQDPRLDVYLPYSQVEDALRHVVLRTRGDPLALARAVREQVQALDPDARVVELTTMQRLVDRALAPWRFASGLLGAFALVALLLTASGLFAVLHHFVSGRTREIAIRMALGADPGRVRRFVLSQGLGVTALGVVLGSGLSLLLARSLSTLLYGLDGRDPWSHFGGVVLIGLVAAAASLVPARRAARVDATVALRSE